MRTRHDISVPVLALALAVGCGAGGEGSSSGSTGGAGSTRAAPSSSGSGGGSTRGSSGSASGTGRTGGGTSGGEGTSTGGATGGPDGGRCGRTQEFGLCAADSDCACPFACNPDDPIFGFSGAPGSVCERRCTTSADCPALQTACQGGFCATDPCDVTRTSLGLPPNGAAGGVCDSADAGDGTCVVLGSGLAVCEQAGGSTASCDPGAVRGDPASLCVPGSVCVAGICRPGCDPADGGACPPGMGCGALDPTLTFLEYGACFPLWDAGCLAGLAGNELAPCGPAAGCACIPGASVACTADGAMGPWLDPYGTATYCERACVTTADCAVPTTACIASRCSDDFCGTLPGGTDAGGHWDGRCDASGQGDGTCLPMRTALADPAYGLCLQGGSATASCAPDAGRSAPTALCAAGSVCVVLADGGAGCFPACNPGVAGGCAAGTGCFGSSQPGASGYAGSCE